MEKAYPSLPDWAYKNLSEKEEKEFREYARKAYVLGTEIDTYWHPACIDECNQMNEEVSQ